MSSQGLQSIEDLKTIFKNQWDKSKTDDLQPEITTNLETPWEELTTNIDTVYIKYDTELLQAGMYNLEKYHDVAISIEVMSPRNQAKADKGQHFKRMLEEAARVIEENPRPTGYIFSLSNETRMRYVKDRGIYIGTIEVDVSKVRIL